MYKKALPSLNTHRRISNSETHFKQSLFSESMHQSISTFRKQSLMNKQPEYCTWQFLQSRKESHLISKYKKRRNRLNKITLENYRIHEKINSQQSQYNYRSDASCEMRHRKYSIKKRIFEGPNQFQRKSLGPISQFQSFHLPVKENKENKESKDRDSQKENMFSTPKTKKELKIKWKGLKNPEKSQNKIVLKRKFILPLLEDML